MQQLRTTIKKPDKNDFEDPITHSLNIIKSDDPKTSDSESEAENLVLLLIAKNVESVQKNAKRSQPYPGQVFNIGGIIKTLESLGNKSSYYALGMIYAGQLFPKDIIYPILNLPKEIREKKAIEYLNRAIDLGSDMAEDFLNKKYSCEKDSYITPSLENWLEYNKKQSEIGNVAASLRLAYAYLGLVEDDDNPAFSFKTFKVDKNQSILYLKRVLCGCDFSKSNEAIELLCELVTANFIRENELKEIIKDSNVNTMAIYKAFWICPNNLRDNLNPSIVEYLKEQERSSSLFVDKINELYDQNADQSLSFLEIAKQSPNCKIANFANVFESIITSSSESNLTLTPSV